MPQYSKAQWRALGRLNIDPLSAEDMRNLAALLHVNQKRIYEAIHQVGPRIADIQKWLKETPVTASPDDSMTRASYTVRIRPRREPGVLLQAVIIPGDRARFIAA